MCIWQTHSCTCKVCKQDYKWSRKIIHTGDWIASRNPDINCDTGGNAPKEPLVLQCDTSRFKSQTSECGKCPVCLHALQDNCSWCNTYREYPEERQRCPRWTQIAPQYGYSHVEIGGVDFGGQVTVLSMTFAYESTKLHGIGYESSSKDSRRARSAGERHRPISSYSAVHSGRHRGQAQFDPTFARGQYSSGTHYAHPDVPGRDVVPNRSREPWRQPGIPPRSVFPASSRSWWRSRRTNKPRWAPFTSNSQQKSHFPPPKIPARPPPRHPHQQRPVYIPPPRPPSRQRQGHYTSPQIPARWHSSPPEFLFPDAPRRGDRSRTRQQPSHESDSLRDVFRQKRDDFSHFIHSFGRRSSFTASRDSESDANEELDLSDEIEQEFYETGIPPMDYVPEEEEEEEEEEAAQKSFYPSPPASIVDESIDREIEEAETPPNLALARQDDNIFASDWDAHSVYELGGTSRLSIPSLISLDDRRYYHHETPDEAEQTDYDRQHDYPDEDNETDDERECYYLDYPDEKSSIDDGALQVALPGHHHLSQDYNTALSSPSSPSYTRSSSPAASFIDGRPRIEEVFSDGSQSPDHASDVYDRDGELDYGNPLEYPYGTGLLEAPPPKSESGESSEDDDNEYDELDYGDSLENPYQVRLLEPPPPDFEIGEPSDGEEYSDDDNGADRYLEYSYAPDRTRMLTYPSTASLGRVVTISDSSESDVGSVTGSDIIEMYERESDRGSAWASSLSVDSVSDNSEYAGSGRVYVR